MEVGNRIFFDQDGDIIFQTGESQGDVLEHKKITSVDFVDLEYGAIDFDTNRIVGINPKTKEPILEQIIIEKTEEEKRIEELENLLLLAHDETIGGIL